MGRPESAITTTGPVADFAERLRLLRRNCRLTLSDLAAKTHYSTATMSVATAGKELPTWDVTAAFVRACGADPRDWHERWEQTAAFSRLPAAMRLPGPATQVPGIADVPGFRQLRREGLLAGPPPLPVTAETPAEFMDCLLRVKIWAGDPPVRALASRAGMPASTMQDFLRGKNRKLPSVETLCSFLGACGIDEQGVIGEWVYTWRRLKFAEVDKRRRHGRRNLAAAS